MKRSPKLLIIDDGDRFVGFAHRFLRSYRYATRCDRQDPCWACPVRRGCTLTHAHDLAEAEAALARHDDVDAVLLDLVFELPAGRLTPQRNAKGRAMPLATRQRQEGLAILAALRPRHPQLPVVLMTSHQGLYDDAARALVARDQSLVLAGDEHFDARALDLLVTRVLDDVVDGPDDYAWGSTEAMRAVGRSARTLAQSSLPILILGETGSGKGALAERVLHPWSKRTGPFVALDLSAVPSNLAAAELFGTARGAFSGAIDRPGRLEAAHEGTLFLDEIGNLPLDAQRLLLRSLEESQVTRIGETKPRRADVRLVAATNADLASMVRAGTFRADLLARLNPRAHLTLPPLRERTADLPALITRFTERAFVATTDRKLLVEYAERIGAAPGPAVAFGTGGVGERVCFVWSRDAVRRLAQHPWPGNLRELLQVVATASLFALGDALSLLKRNVVEDRAAARWIPIPNALVETLLATVEPDAATGNTNELRVTLRPDRSLRGSLRGVERQIYQRLFLEADGDFAQMASRLLGSTTPAAARQVRLRYNQLGLRVRNTKLSKTD